MPSPTRGTTPGRFRDGSVIARSRARQSIRPWRRTGLGISGGASDRWLAGFSHADKDADDADARGRRGIMLGGLLAVPIVGTLAGSLEADRGDGRYRTPHNPSYS